jgi:hypothetical protein
MVLSGFDDRSRQPTDGDVAKAIGKTKVLWDDLKRRIAAAHDPLEEEWTFAGKNYGWSLRLKRKKRAVLYMTPKEGFFGVGFALGEKAVAAARGGGLPAWAMEIIDEAPRYAEGRGVRLEIRAAKDVAVAEKIAAIKMAN